MNKEDENTFSITFKTTNDGYAYILSFIESHTNLISDKVLPNTQTIYDTDEVFKKLVKNVKNAQRQRDEYINKNL